MSNNRTGPFWVDNPLWSSQLRRLIALAGRGGADLIEASSAVADVASGDHHGWYAAFHELAVRLEADGEAVTKTHPIAARDVLWRSSMYHRNAAAFLMPSDRRSLESLDGRRRTFRAAAELHPVPIEPVDIPFAGGDLPGYFCSPNRATGSEAPAVIVIGGTDGAAEEMYFAVGRALCDRGYAVLVFDGPGQGEALRRGVVARPDFEVAVSACVDQLRGRADVDPDRIGLIGHSLGGYYAARAAARERRLRATVVCSGPFDFGGTVAARIEQAPPDDPGVAFLTRLYTEITGTTSVAEALAVLADFHVRDLAVDIRAPLLAAYGEDDPLVGVANGERLVAAAGSTDKELMVFRSGRPGSTHCQQDAPVVAEYPIGNWIEEHV
ncbi:alpha/beta hydrolase family protein [Pseudonocardia adelaidensis]|uniref:Alpha/beta hydrolase n=1 Tax=Pseudonocardia adelaidensis TaxID=648754 RepID=A0ABP9NGR8_9PSEU